MWSFVKKIKAFIFKALGREGKPTGKPQKLTPKAQERISTANLDRHAERLVALTKKLNSGKIDGARWQEGVRTDLRHAYIQNYLLGIGGKGQLTKKDYGAIGGMLREQYKWLKGLVSDITSGKASQAQIEARIRMYASSAREAYERGRARAWGDATEECWRTNPDPAAEHCSKCLEFEAMGWKKKGYFPFPGQGKTPCLTACQCTKLYRWSIGGRNGF